MLAKIACIVKDLATYFTLVLFLPWCMFSHVTIIWPWTNVRFSTYLTCVFWLAIICNVKKIHYWNSLSIIWTLEERRLNVKVKSSTYLWQVLNGPSHCLWHCIIPCWDSRFSKRGERILLLAIKVSNDSCTFLNQEKNWIKQKLSNLIPEIFLPLVQQNTVTFLIFDYPLPGLLLRKSDPQ